MMAYAGFPNIRFLTFLLDICQAKAPFSLEQLRMPQVPPGSQSDCQYLSGSSSNCGSKSKYYVTDCSGMQLAYYQRIDVV